MVGDTGRQAPSPHERAEVPRERWQAWCERTTEVHAGTPIDLIFIDDALGEVRLAAGEPLVAIEHDELGSVVAMTVRFGAGVLPRTYVVAEPRAVTQALDSTGSIVEVRIVDSTNRRTVVSLAGAGSGEP